MRLETTSYPEAASMIRDWIRRNGIKTTIVWCSGSVEEVSTVDLLTMKHN